jgi:hypothetical protein
MKDNTYGGTVMPSHYTHYRFGNQVIDTLPPETRNRIQRFRQLYDVGLQGPDIFLYHNIFRKDSTVALSGHFHRQTGQELFTEICRRLRTEPGEGGLAYLYGLLAHYCLDSTCHPFIRQQTADGTITHAELEAELDRFLLFQDGHRPVYSYDFRPHLKLTPGECATAASLYPPATDTAVNRSLRCMASSIRFLTPNSGFHRGVLKLCMKLTGDKFTPHIMHRSPNKTCAHLNQPLLELYGKALENYPRMLENLLQHLYGDEPLGPEFDTDFG